MILKSNKLCNTILIYKKQSRKTFSRSHFKIIKYHSSDRRRRWEGHVAPMGESKGAYKIFMGKPKKRRPLGKPRRSLGEVIKMDLREVGWGHGLGRSCSGQGQVVGFCKCGNEPWGSIKSEKYLE